MIRQLLALTLAALILPSPAKCLTAEQVSQKASQIPIGSVVDVKAKSGKLRGQLLAVESTGVVVRTAQKDGPVVEKAVAFTEMKDIKFVDTSDKTTRGLASFGGGMLVLVIISIIITSVAGGA